MIFLKQVITFIFLLTAVKPNTYPGTFVIGQNIIQLTYTSTTIASYIHFQLYLTPFYSPGLLIGRKNNFNISTNRQDWMHFDYLNSNDCDYEGMVTGKSQYGWVNNMGIGTTLYLKLINFDTSPFSYIINVTESNSLLKICPVGVIKIPNRQYCAFCDYLHLGTYCQIEKHSIGASYQYLDNLFPQSYNYFLLLSQQQIIISMTYNHAIRIYIQGQQSADELAGVSNYVGMYLQSQNTSLIIDFNGKGRNILVGVINPNINSVLFSLNFKVKQEENIIMIIVSILGGILVLGLILAGFIIFKKMNNSQRIVHSQQTLFQRRKVKFSPEQIQIYFPSIQMAKICQIQISFNNLKDNCQQNETQCVICLCSIQNQDLVRVGYCKHIFHANCLSEWFKKQQNCPYCRQDYSRQSTAQHYNKLVKKVGKNLKGQQIARSVFVRSQNISMITLSIQTTQQTFE